MVGPPRRAHDGRRPYHRQPRLVVGKCAFPGTYKVEGSIQVIPGRSHFGLLLLVDHRLL